MSIKQSQSPAGLDFGPRRPSFELAQGLASDWHGGSAFRTAYFNAMSMLFPLGEKFFIDSVRYFKDEIEDTELLNEITAFQGQEATHRRQHQDYNELLCRQRGYDLERFERPLRDRMAWAYRTFSPRRRLAGTVANEHLTAIMANDMLRYRDAFSGADPHVAALWQWHGVEETEHKAVAFDVFVAVDGTVRERRQALVMNTFFFFKDTFRIMCLMLKADGKLWSLREWASGFKFLFLRPGILRRVVIPYFKFYRRDFHPWQHDNRALIADWEREYGSSISRIPN
jgi:predicted metal-dependent hydrolase